MPAEPDPGGRAFSEKCPYDLAEVGQHVILRSNSEEFSTILRTAKRPGDPHKSFHSRFVG
jgi:hypothetical protein